MTRLTAFAVPGAPDRWTTLGFVTAGSTLRVGAVALTCAAPEPAWGFDRLLADPETLGVPTSLADAPAGDAPVHPNGVDRLDHVVYGVPDLDAAVAAIGSVLGLEVRRRLTPRPGGPEMAFFRAGEAVLEVVGAGAAAALWGVAFRCPDLDSTVMAVREAGGPVSDAKTSIQGGRIATVPTGHVGWRVAFMEPPPR